MAPAVVAAAAAMSSARQATAQQAYFSATGTFSVAASQFQDFNLFVGATSNTTFRTLAWSGGTDAAGDSIAIFGIDSVLTLFNGSNTQIAQNDNVNGSTNDAEIDQPTLAAGS